MSEQNIYLSEGDTFVGHEGPDRREVTATVASHFAATRGYWLCVTCDEYLGTNMDRDTHTERPGEHRLTWDCVLHGPEVP